MNRSAWTGVFLTRHLAEESHANTVLWDKDGTKFMMSNELSVHPSWRKRPQRAAWFKRT